MQNVSKQNTKKGDTIIRVSPYNHHFNCKRTPMRGESTISEDSYNVEVWNVQSISDKVLKLVDAEGTKGSQFSSRNGEYGVVSESTYTMFKDVENRDELIMKAIKAMRENDEHKTDTFSIKKIRITR